MTKSDQLLAVIAGIVVSLIFGLSFLFTKNSLSLMSPIELLANRFTLAAIFLFLLNLTGVVRIRLNLKRFAGILPLTLFQPILYFLGETFGIQLTSASESSLVIALIPVAVTILGGLFLHEQAGWRQWLFVLCSVAGVGMIVLAGSGANLAVHTAGMAILLLAVAAAAVYNILSRRYSATYSPLEITTGMMYAGAVFFNLLRLTAFPAKGFYFQGFTRIGSLFPLIYLGLLSSVGAFFLVNYMLKKMAVAKVAAFNNLTTVVSVAAGVIFRGEALGPYHLVGGSLILIGVWGINALDKSKAMG
ncbi:MAG TPA: DMT family transporter [Bacillota bacterium]